MHDTGIGESNHVLGIVDEEARRRLHDEVGRPADFAQHILAGHAEQLEANAERAAEIGVGRTGVARKAHPGIEAFMRENRSEEHTSELQSLMRISYAVFCLKKKKNKHTSNTQHNTTNK